MAAWAVGTGPPISCPGRRCEWRPSGVAAAGSRGTGAILSGRCLVKGQRVFPRQGLAALVSMDADGLTLGFEDNRLGSGFATGG
jgi:hypothetical protein